MFKGYKDSWRIESISFSGHILVKLNPVDNPNGS